MLLLINTILKEMIFHNNENDFPVLLQFSLVLLLLFVICPNLMAQWNNDPVVNKIFASEGKSQVNINVTGDGNGGGFLFWEDKPDSLGSNIFFQHFDEDGVLNFPPSGKSISSGKSLRNAPSACMSRPGTAAVIYKDLAGRKNSPSLYAQCISSKGEYLWGREGIKLTDHLGEALEHTVTSDEAGNVYVAYIYQDNNTPVNYNLYLQLIKPSGALAFRGNGQLITSSARIKSHPQVAIDKKGGVYIFWVESNEAKGRIYAQHINAAGKSTWGIKSVAVSGASDNVFGYSVLTAFGNCVYVNWEVRKSTRDIFHQLINENGKFLWARTGEPVTNKYGNQTNPQAIYADSSITLSWTSESANDKDIYAQKFNFSGKPLWRKDGVAVIKAYGNQSGQRLVSDRRGGAVIAWIDKKQKTQKGNILAQRISPEGKLLWDSTGTALASNQGSEKSYLQLLPNKATGAVAVFKENRAGQNAIYAQRILGDGKFLHEVSGFRAIYQNGMSHISWVTNKSTNVRGYNLERKISDTSWKVVTFQAAKNRPDVNNYEFTEPLPGYEGVYYRLTEIDREENRERSNTIRVDYINLNSGGFALTQNYPNPFTDSTQIKYYLPERAKVLLDIYNDKIETVSVLIDDVQEKGEYSFTIRAKNTQGRLPAGVYFYRLKAGDYIDVKKMVIIQ